MLISEKHNFAFIHVPRTGGNSISKALAVYCKIGAAPEVGVHKFQMLLTKRTSPGIKTVLADLVQHTPLRFFVSTAGHPTAALARLLYPNFSSYHSFSFVRNPYERIVSGYARAKEWDGVDIDFGEYLKAANLQLQPQVNFVSFGKRIIVDFVGRHERLQDDFDHVCNWLGFPNMTLPVLSATAKFDYRDVLTPKTKKIVEDIYDADFAAFSYERH